MTKSMLPWLTLITLLAGAAAPAALAQESAAPAGAEAGQGAAQATPYAALADILEDEQARQDLVTELRSLAATPPGEAAQQAPADQKAEPKLARSLALATESLAEDISNQVAAVIAALTFSGGQGVGPAFDPGALLAAITRLLAVILATVIVFLVLRAVVHPLFSGASRWAGNGNSGLSEVVHRISAISLALVVDIAVVLLACVAGYAVGLYAVGDQGSIGTRESLFINAFAMIEIFKALIRMVLPSRYEGLRLFPISAEVAAWWSKRLRWFAGFIGYGLLVLVPILNVELGRGLGAMVNLLIMLVAYIYALTVILRNRSVLRQRFEAQAEQTSAAVFGVLLRVAAKLWHVVAIIYFTVLFLVSQLRPEEALPFMVKATFQTLLAVAIGAALSLALGALIGRRIRIGNRLRQRMPQIEDRVNLYVPGALKVIRILIFLVVALVVLDAWRLFNFADWLTSDAGLHTIAIIVRVALILAVAAVVWTVTISIIESRMGGELASARHTTLLGLFRSGLAIVIGTFTAMIVLSQIGVAIGPLIAGAGVLGLAIGFGSQKMVSDVITGIFIQMDNAMNVGDVVTVAGVTGTVERLGIRSTAIRALDGTLHIVRLSSVDIVSNYMREFAYHVGEYRISFRDDIDGAIVHLRAAFDELKLNETQGPNIIEDLAVPGVIALADNSVVIRVMIKTKPGSQWAVGRAYNRLVKLHFDAAGIEIPFPHSTIFFGHDKSGSAPPAHLRLMQQDFAIEGGPVGQPHSPPRQRPDHPDHSETPVSKEQTIPDQDDR